MRGIADFVELSDQLTAEKAFVASVSNNENKDDNPENDASINNKSNSLNDDVKEDPVERERQMKLEFQKGIEKFN